DAYGNEATGYTGTVAFTSSDGQAVLPGNYTFVADDGGQHTFTAGVTFKTAGPQTVTATDTVTSTTHGTSSSATITAAAASHLVLSGLGGAVAGVAQSPTVEAEDAYGNQATGYTGTVAFTSSDGQAVLPGNYTFVADDGGQHTFTAGVTFKTAGPQTVTATDTVTSTTHGTSSSATITAAAASHLVLTGLAGDTAGTAQSPTVEAEDAYGNEATGYTGTVAFTSSDGQAVLPGNYTFVADDGGQHTFTDGVTFKTAGPQTVTATDTVTGGITGTETGVAVTPASATHFTVTGLTGGGAGTIKTVTVTAFDAYGNLATGYTGTIHFTSSD